MPSLPGFSFFSARFSALKILARKSHFLARESHFLARTKKSVLELTVVDCICFPRNALGRFRRPKSQNFLGTAKTFRQVDPIYSKEELLFWPRHGRLWKLRVKLPKFFSALFTVCILWRPVAWGKKHCAVNLLKSVLPKSVKSIRNLTIRKSCPEFENSGFNLVRHNRISSTIFFFQRNSVLHKRFGFQYKSPKFGVLFELAFPWRTQMLPNPEERVF